MSAINKEGNKNPEYYKQDLEFDVFAFAVIKYKYGDIHTLKNELNTEIG